MLLRTLALVTAMTGAALAQCGTNSLPTTYANNNSGSAGGAIYFQLNVLNPNGISICGIRMNSTTAAGQPMSGTIHRHTTLTDSFALTSANVVAANWDTLCGFSGTTAGIGQPSTTSIVGVPTLDLAPGLHLLCINACPNFAHAYTNLAPAGQTYTDGNVTYYGGRATNIEFSGTPFGTTTLARVSNITLDYTIPGAPVSTTPGGFVGVCSSVSSVGTGCAPGTDIGASVHEVFATTPDLIVPATSSQDLVFVDSAGTVSTFVTPGTAIVPPVSANLALGDDQNTALIPMGFTASFGGRSFSAISMASNGYVWLGGTGAADFTPTAAELTAAGPARIAPYWFDFAPNLGGSTHIDIGTNIVTCTWLNVFAFGGTAAHGTVQLEITPSQMVCRYDFNQPWGATNTRLLGFSNGVAHTTPAPVDLNGGAVANVTGLVSGITPLMTQTTPPLVGTNVTWTASGLDATGLSGVLLEIGAASAPVLLSSPPFGPGCNQRVSPNAIVLSLFFGVSSGTSSVAIPAGPTFAGLPLVVQAASAAGNFPWTVSNALNNIIGSL